VSWEEAAQAAAAKLKAVYDASGKDAIGFIGSNRTSNEENICCSGWRARRLGRTNIDHHRTADYTGLITALGERAGDSLLTMEQFVSVKSGFWWWETTRRIRTPWSDGRFRSGIRHFGTKLFIINANEIKLKRKATQFVKVEAARRPPRCDGWRMRKGNSRRRWSNNWCN